MQNLLTIVGHTQIIQFLGFFSGFCGGVKKYKDSKIYFVFYNFFSIISLYQSMVVCALFSWQNIFILSQFYNFFYINFRAHQKEINFATIFINILFYRFVFYIYMYMHPVCTLLLLAAAIWWKKKNYTISMQKNK